MRALYMCCVRCISFNGHPLWESLYIPSVIVHFKDHSYTGASWNKWQERYSTKSMTLCVCTCVLMKELMYALCITARTCLNLRSIPGPLQYTVHSLSHAVAHQYMVHGDAPCSAICNMHLLCWITHLPQGQGGRWPSACDTLHSCGDIVFW